MQNKNQFWGYSKKAKFARTSYYLLMSRKWISYADIIATANIKSARIRLDSVANSDFYGELKKIFPVVCKLIKNKEGENSIEKQGNNRNRRFRYIGKDDNPLADMMNANVVKDLDQYWQFCQDSAGFFPISWLEHFFCGSMDIIQMRANKRKGKQVIIADQDRQLKNIELLPCLYENIINHQVLSVKYKPFGEVAEELVFHPHYLKEYNGRWFLFGHAVAHVPEFGYNLPLDRIVETPCVVKEMKYIAPPPSFYENYFKGVVGVSRRKGRLEHDIIVRANTHYIYMLTETKKLHLSQNIVKPFNKYEDGEYGEFMVHVEVNDEFIGRILQMGAGLEIVYPKEVRKIFKDRVSELYHLYESD